MVLVCPQLSVTWYTCTSRMWPAEISVDDQTSLAVDSEVIIVCLPRLLPCIVECGTALSLTVRYSVYCIIV